MKLKLEIKTSASGPVDLDVLAVFQEKAPQGKGAKGKVILPQGEYSEVVDRFRRKDSGVFSAGLGSVEYLRFGGRGQASSVLFCGMGPADELTLERARVAAGHVWSRAKAQKEKTLTIHLDSLVTAKGLKPELAAGALARAFAEGLLLGAYEFIKHKSGGAAQEAYKAPEKIILLTGEKTLAAELNRELPGLLAIAEAMKVARDWSNEPSNIGTPEYFASESRKLAAQYGLKCRVLTERDAAREKMGLYLGVSQGAEREGKIVVLEYLPKGAKKNLKTIALVGKGVTFDSGGISIKPSARMEEMKHDMTGAATVMGAILLAASWKVPNRVLAVLAFCENMPDGNAIQPGNVLTARNGKTVEVVNTDAEGRLILADALDYAQDFKPDAVIDVATLTGAVGIALGKYCCGIMGNEDSLIESVKRAGEVNGERVWQLPCYDEYFEDMKSDTADMKNVGNDGYGGASRGAVFLKQFIRKGMPWAHMDIATTAAGLSYLSYYPKKGASGAYVRTLARFAQEF